MSSIMRRRRGLDSAIRNSCLWGRAATPTILLDRRSPHDRPASPAQAGSFNPPMSQPAEPLVLDVAGSYTWFDPKLGFEVDLTPGVMFNAQNPATDYHTGTEFHLDRLVGQHVSEHFAVAVTGYYYKQIADDGGAIPLGIDARHFTGTGAGIGPAVNVNLPILGRTV